MTAAKHAGQGRVEGPPPTLGDLLYADRTKAAVPEAEWSALVRSIADGDQASLRAIYDRMHGIVFTLAMRLLNDRASAEEVMLDVFHEIWRRAAKYDAADGTVVGWIMNLARSRAIDRVRFERRKKRMRPEGETAEPAATEAGDELGLRERGRALRQALVVLTADERQAIEVAYFSGLTYAEVATALRQPVGTIKTRIRAGLAKLRRALTEAGFGT